MLKSLEQGGLRQFGEIGKYKLKRLNSKDDKNLQGCNVQYLKIY